MSSQFFVAVLALSSLQGSNLGDSGSSLLPPRLNWFDVTWPWKRTPVPHGQHTPLCELFMYSKEPKKSCCNFFLQNHIHCFYSLTFKWFHHLKTKSKSPFLLYNDQNRHKQFAKSTKINHKVLVHVGISAGEVLGVRSWVFCVWGLGLNPKPKTK